jgi:hypothetical protein
MNALLESVQKDVVILKAHLLGTWDLIPSPLLPVACALTREVVPTTWSSHQSELRRQTISIWLKGIIHHALLSHSIVEYISKRRKLVQLIMVPKPKKILP